jgi:hypothetical protein
MIDQDLNRHRRSPLCSVIDQYIGSASFTDRLPHYLHGLLPHLWKFPTILVYGSARFFAASWDMFNGMTFVGFASRCAKFFRT